MMNLLSGVLVNIHAAAFVILPAADGKKLSAHSRRAWAARQIASVSVVRQHARPDTQGSLYAALSKLRCHNAEPDCMLPEPSIASTNSGAQHAKAECR